MRRVLIVPILAFLILIGAVACDDTKNVPPNPGQIAQQNRLTSVDQRAENFKKAADLYPQPQQENFPLRQALVKYTERQDLVNHPWYIYIKNVCYQCPGGISYQYFIGQTYPLSTCDFLGSTEEVQNAKITGDNGNALSTVVVKAPSLDGIYYGGSGAEGGCDYFFFEQATDAMEVIHHDEHWFVSDKLLLLDATAVTVR